MIGSSVYVILLIFFGMITVDAILAFIFYRFFQHTRYVARNSKQKEKEKQLEAARGFYK
jgi:hypothetical protein